MNIDEARIISYNELEQRGTRMKAKLKAHLWTLPRWFAIISAVSAIVLGGIISGALIVPIILASISGLLLMASGHSFNTFLDYEWTKLDRGEPDERSRPKEYTGGQQPIGTGVLSAKEVLANALGWLVLSVVPAVFLPHIVWLPWTLGALVTFWYSWAKLHWHPEVALGIGFATFGVWLGMAASGHIDFWLGFLVSLPFLVLWGGLAEIIDQWIDWEPNWPKGARSTGMLLGKLGIPLRWIIPWGMSIVYLLQIFLISVGLLAPWTGLAFLAVIPISACAMLIDSDLKKGVLWGLLGIFLYQVLLVMGQAL